MRIRFTTVSLALCLGNGATLAGDAEVDKQIPAARAAAQALQTALAKELHAALEAGGPAQGIDVCSRRAGVIAADVSRTHAAEVGRTTQRTRNPANAPDTWAQQGLRELERRKAAGEDPQQLEHAEIVMQNGMPTFRYLKAIAIPANGPCLMCHGDKLNPAVSAALDERYPSDTARGYRVGDIRGAFSVTRPLAR